MGELSIILPVEGPISGRFGEWYDLPGRPPYQHRGLDIKAPVGAPIKAPADGRVVRFTNDGSFGWKAICLYHEASGLYLLMAHGSESYVSIGQEAKQGELIGRVGNEGLSTGSHCHLQVCRTSTFPTDISYSYDPESFLVKEEDAPMTPKERQLLAVASGEWTNAWSAYRALRAGTVIAEGDHDGSFDLDGNARAGLSAVEVVNAAVTIRERIRFAVLTAPAAALAAIGG